MSTQAMDKQRNPRYARLSHRANLSKSLLEQLLQEKTRQELISKSKSGADYKDTSKGRNRWERRTRSKIANSIRDYNQIDMDSFFKGDILEFVIKVNGETDNYEVRILFEGILAEVRKEVASNNNKLEFKCILRALLRVFNQGDVYVGCSCPDFTYRFKYWANKNQYSSQIPDKWSNVAPLPHDKGGASGANDKDDKGAACKHVNLAISNTDWMMKVASVINNYIKWCKDNMGRNYADYIFPQVYGVPYNKAIQMSLFDDPDDNGLLPSDQKTLSQVISKSLGGKDDKGKWTKDNTYKFQKTGRSYGKEDPRQLHLDLRYGDGRTKEIIPDEEDR